MKAGMPALLLLLAAQAGAQTFVSMGRLFTTPGERAQLDAQRGQAVLVAPGTRGPAPGTLPGSGQADGMANEGQYSTPVPAGAPGRGTYGDAGAGAVAGAEDTPAGLRLDGVIRRSNGPAVIILNGEVQAAPARGVLRGGVRLQADGRAVTLKPGQRYDPATGVIHEVAR